MYEKSVGQISIITKQDMLGMSRLKPWQSFIEICRLENWDSDFHIFHNNYFENINFEFFRGKSIHLYIHNHFTTYFSATASLCTVIHRMHPMDHECKAAHKFQHFKILVDFQGFTCQASWSRPVRRTQSIIVDSGRITRAVRYDRLAIPFHRPTVLLPDPALGPDRIVIRYVRLIGLRRQTRHNTYISFFGFWNLCLNFARSFALMIRGMYMPNDGS